MENIEKKTFREATDNLYEAIRKFRRAAGVFSPVLKGWNLERVIRREILRIRNEKNPEVVKTTEVSQVLNVKELIRELSKLSEDKMVVFVMVDPETPRDTHDMILTPTFNFVLRIDEYDSDAVGIFLSEL